MDNNQEKLVEEIYTAALDRNRWPQLLTQIGALLGGASGLIGVQNATGEMAWERATPSDPEGVALLRKQSSPLDTHPVTCACYSRTGVVEPMLTEINRCQGLRYGITIPLIQSPFSTAVLKFIRPLNKELYTQKEINGIRRLTPHLRRALVIDHQLSSAKIKLNSLAALLNALRTATFLLNSAAHLLYANTAAKEILRREDGLRSRASRLFACQRDCDIALKGILAKATRSWLPPRTSWPIPLSIHRSSDHQQPYIALAVPYSRSYLFPARPEVEPTVMLFISDPETAPHPENEILQRLYGLTGTEAHITTLLASGRKPQEIADTLHVSLNTIKTHLKNAFSKTGVRRQAELIQLYFTAFSTLVSSCPPCFDPPGSEAQILDTTCPYHPNG